MHAFPSSKTKLYPKTQNHLKTLVPFRISRGSKALVFMTRLFWPTLTFKTMIPFKIQWLLFGKTTHGTNFTAPMLVSPWKDSYFWSSIGKKFDFWIMSQQLPSKLHKINEFFKFLHILERIKKKCPNQFKIDYLHTKKRKKKLFDIIYFSAF